MSPVSRFGIAALSAAIAITITSSPANTSPQGHRQSASGVQQEIQSQRAKPGKGTLRLRVKGVPRGRSARLVIANWRHRVKVAARKPIARKKLPPGRYTISALPVTVRRSTFGAKPQKVRIRKGRRATAVVTFRKVAQVSRKTEVLTPSESRRVVKVTADSVVFSGGSSPVQRGDVLVAAPASGIPEGLLRRVVAVSPTPEGVAAKTVPAALTEALSEASVSTSGLVLTPDSPTVVDATGTSENPGALSRQTQASVNVPITLSKEWSETKGPTSVSANVTIELEQTVDVDLQIRRRGWSGSLESFSTRLKSRRGITGTLSATQGVEMSTTKDLPKVRLGTAVIMAGPVPIAFTFRLDPKLKGKVGFQRKASATLGAEVTDETELFYRDGKWGGSARSTWKTSGDLATGGWGGYVEAGGQFDLAVSLYDQVGPFVGVDGKVRAEATPEASDLSRGRWALKGIVGANIGGKVTLLGVKDFDLTIPLAEKTWSIKEGTWGPRDVPAPPGFPDMKGKIGVDPGGTAFYIDLRGGRHWIPDGGTFECLVAQGKQVIRGLDAGKLRQYPGYESAECVRAQPGNVIRHKDGDAYVLNSNWTRSWIPTGTSYVCNLANRTLVNNVPRYYIDDLTRVGDSTFPTGNCIIRKPGGAAFFVNNEGKREWVPDSPTWDCETGRGVRVINSSDAFVNSVTETGWHYCLNKANLRGKILRHNDGDAHYIHPDDTRTWIPDEFTFNCRTAQGTPVVGTLWREYVNEFRDTGWDYCFNVNTFLNRHIVHPEGDRHFVGGDGRRHWIPGDRAECMTSRYGAPATVRWREYINNITEGEWAVCGDTLYRNQLMDRGQWLRSGDGRYTLHMQTDGNLVLYNQGGAAIWATNRQGRHLKLHDDGCLAEVDYSGNWLWQTGCNQGGDRLVVQSDGNLVLYAGGRAVWASNTAGR